MPSEIFDLKQATGTSTDASVPSGAGTLIGLIRAVRDFMRAFPSAQDALARASAQVVAPAAGAVIADTGQLAAGTYRVEVHMAFADTLAAGKALILEYRNAANSATLHSAVCPAGATVRIVISRITIVGNERFRVINAAVVGVAGSVANAYIEVVPVT